MSQLLGTGGDLLSLTGALLIICSLTMRVCSPVKDGDEARARAGETWTE